MNEEDESSDPGLAATAYSLWSRYWLELGPKIPPLHLSKYTASGGVLFFAPMGRPELQTFITAMSKDSDITFLMEGDAMIKEHSWLGHWCAFSIKAKALKKIPLRPSPPPRVPGGWPF